MHCATRFAEIMGNFDKPLVFKHLYWPIHMSSTDNAHLMRSGCRIHGVPTMGTKMTEEKYFVAYAFNWVEGRCRQSSIDNPLMGRVL